MVEDDGEGALDGEGVELESGEGVEDDCDGAGDGAKVVVEYEGEYTGEGDGHDGRGAGEGVQAAIVFVGAATFAENCPPMLPAGPYWQTQNWPL